jgi:DNA-directed RNA polymerase alpha subunit
MKMPRQKRSRERRVAVEKLHQALGIEWRKTITCDPSKAKNQTLIERLGLSARTLNALKRRQFNTVGQVAELLSSDVSLLRIKKFGKTSLAELIAKYQAFTAEQSVGYEEMAKTAEYYLNYMQQKSTEAFAAMKEGLPNG